MPPPSSSSSHRKPTEPLKTNERNEYIPAFISKKPFYVDPSGESSSAADDYLEHQRLQDDNRESSLANQRWYDRGRKTGQAATKFRKGACENCGAMTHKAKECLSAPRAKGARWTGRNIEADERVEKIDLGWDAKRDRWNGYDAKEYASVVKDYDELERMKKAAAAKSNPDDEGQDEAEGDRYEEETDMGRQQSTSTRNLRIREDTAKYLVNLDLDSAKYDPKTRSMLDAGSKSDKSSQLVAEEGFMRASGDAAEFEKAQKYAWESQERGNAGKVHLQANPTSGEFFRKKEAAEKDAKRAARQKMLLDQYGSQTQHARIVPIKDAQVTENEKFVEYDARGLIKGSTAIKAKSQYAEDVHSNNHTSVWGSWWRDFKWGYACCHSQVKNSYCTGEEGRAAFENADQLRLGENLRERTEVASKDVAQWSEVGRDKQEPGTADKDEKSNNSISTKKRTLEELTSGIDDEDLEEYRKRRVTADDPMAAHLGKDELVH